MCVECDWKIEKKYIDSKTDWPLFGPILDGMKNKARGEVKGIVLNFPAQYFTTPCGEGGGAPWLFNFGMENFFKMFRRNLKPLYSMYQGKKRRNLKYLSLSHVKVMENNLKVGNPSVYRHTLFHLQFVFFFVFLACCSEPQSVSSRLVIWSLYHFWVSKKKFASWLSLSLSLVLIEYFSQFFFHAHKRTVLLSCTHYKDQIILDTVSYIANTHTHESFSKCLSTLLYYIKIVSYWTATPTTKQQSKQIEHGRYWIGYQRGVRL